MNTKYRYLKNKIMPKDVKQIPLTDLTLFCDEVRQELIQIISKTGGHAGPNLGVVELTVALYYVFDFPEDKVVWDIGHQIYVQKMLTARSDKLKTNRQNGMSPGYSFHEESDYDTVTSSHAGASISLALGMGLSKKMKDESSFSIAVVGDGAFVEGSNHEALNHMAVSTCKTIVVLNDNERAIDKNYGGYYEYFKLRKIGTDIPETFFGSLGIPYYGPIDGHNVLDLVEKFSDIKKNITKPVILHIKTMKGKGLDEMANNSPIRIHWNHAFNPKTYEKTEISKGKGNEGFVGAAVEKILEDNINSVLITPAVRGNAGVDGAFIKYGDKCIDVSLAEQHAVTLGGGFALNGIKPIVAMESTFMIRSFGQIKHDICINNLPVLITAARTGHGFTDHITHNALQDISYLRCMPNLRLLYPVSCEDLTSTILEEYKNLSQPTIILFPKANILEDPDQGLVSCSENNIKKTKGARGLLLSIGPQNKNAQELQKMLKSEGIIFDHIAVKQIAPLSSNVKQILSHFDYIITLEEGVLDGGFGSLILEHMNSLNVRAKLMRIGFKKQFIEHGTREYIYEKYGLDADSVYTRIKNKWSNLWDVK